MDKTYRSGLANTSAGVASFKSVTCITIIALRVISAA